MQQTIFSLLTSKQARNQSAVRLYINREFSAGAPWFDIAMKKSATI